MLAAALRFCLLLEVGLYALIANRLFDFMPGDAMVVALCTLLGGRVSIIAATYMFAYVHHSRAPKIGWLHAIVVMFLEYLAFLRLFLIIQPFERLWMGADRLLPGRQVLLLVHGYGCNRGAWWWLRRRLERAGYVVATLNLEPVYTSIDGYVDPLEKRIEEVCRETGCQRLTLIGHSMGGLVSRAYLAARGEARVDRLLTIGTPHSGSVIARLGVGANARQMERGSPWLRALWQHRPRIPVISLRNTHDNFVMPQDSQRFPGAADIELPALGHLAVLFSNKAADALLGALRR